MKKLFDSIKTTVTSSSGTTDNHPLEVLDEADLFVANTFRHGFPFEATCMDFDPIQKLLAVGTWHGKVHIFGKPGVECVLETKHDDGAILQLIFLVNEGVLISRTEQDNINLWSLRQKPPELVRSIKFSKERVSFCFMSLGSKWLYVGTDTANVHMVHVETFETSGYVIHWNKCIDLSEKGRPGKVIHISECPTDDSKLFIGFSSGKLIKWNLTTKTVEYRWSFERGFESICWSSDGQRFACSHHNGSITIWKSKDGSSKPEKELWPHAVKQEMKKSTSSPAASAKGHHQEFPSPPQFLPVKHLQYALCSSGSPYIIFSGGLPIDQPLPDARIKSRGQKSGERQKAGHEKSTESITVLRQNGQTKLIMLENAKSHVIDIRCIYASPRSDELRDPSSIIVLLKDDIMVFELKAGKSDNFTCAPMDIPYATDLNDSPVTCCRYFFDPDSRLVPSLYSAGLRQRPVSCMSSRVWPIDGGTLGEVTCGAYSELIVTGHADGTVKFWDATGINFVILYHLRFQKLFNKPKPPPPPRTRRGKKKNRQQQQTSSGGSGTGESKAADDGAHIAGHNKEREPPKFGVTTDETPTSRQVKNNEDQRAQSNSYSLITAQDLLAVQCITLDESYLCVASMSDLAIYRLQKGEAAFKVDKMEVALHSTTCGGGDVVETVTAGGGGSTSTSASDDVFSGFTPPPTVSTRLHKSASTSSSSSASTPTGPEPTTGHSYPGTPNFSSTNNGGSTSSPTVNPPPPSSQQQQPTATTCAGGATSSQKQTDAPTTSDHPRGGNTGTRHTKETKSNDPYVPRLYPVTGELKFGEGYHPDLLVHLFLEGGGGSSSPGPPSYSPFSGTPAIPFISTLQTSHKSHLLSVGHVTGLLIIDIIQQVVVLNLSTAALYGSLNPNKKLVFKSAQASTAAPVTPADTPTDETTFFKLTPVSSSSALSVRRRARGGEGSLSPSPSPSPSRKGGRNRGATTIGSSSAAVVAPSPPLSATSSNESSPSLIARGRHSLSTPHIILSKTKSQPPQSSFSTHAHTSLYKSQSDGSAKAPPSSGSGEDDVETEGRRHRGFSEPLIDIPEDLASISSSSSGFSQRSIIFYFFQFFKFNVGRL